MTKLTEFSPGAGCGCKISPQDLEIILKSEAKTYFPNLLVGNESKDDAAIFDIGNGKAIISTTDFFTPIVDDPFDFGRVAATNAISDIYAMGGTPIMAIAILGWPLDKLPAELAKEVIEGAKSVCKDANIPLAGGHSIDISDPIFGLAVTGIIDIENIKQNNKAEKNNILFLTKPLGIGILTTAEKQKKIKPEHSKIATELMTNLNKAGEIFGKLPYVKSMTDVTGFGLLGHLLEICEGSNLNAVIEFEKVPLINGIEYYITEKCFPGGTFRNWKSYKSKIKSVSDKQKVTLCDPQTSGGLLVAVSEEFVNDFQIISSKNNIQIHEIGKLVKRNNEEYYVEVI
ncbi:MAG TPA: selenide, water dikinase SelD [Bacteroidales bacterium]|nr:MAG: selenide, water dikinase SelD [Bacteroidetes bacterium GWF2_33_38]OFY85967.1 MAG: selenide, water dikinase SelD [Bacteroidetes bacterium RIFOXYA2_FULL_33_7]HBF88751.1 selenide, water dikinase SelD [Bacteroidales bacterium]